VKQIHWQFEGRNEEEEGRPKHSTSKGMDTKTTDHMGCKKMAFRFASHTVGDKRVSCTLSLYIINHIGVASGKTLEDTYFRKDGFYMHMKVMNVT
jgi:hypothetical protein